MSDEQAAFTCYFEFRDALETFEPLGDEDGWPALDDPCDCDLCFGRDANDFVAATQEYYNAKADQEIAAAELDHDRNVVEENEEIVLMGQCGSNRAERFCNGIRRGSSRPARKEAA